VLGTRHPVALTQLRRRPLSSCRASFWFVVDCAFLWKVMTTSRRLVSPAGRRFFVCGYPSNKNPGGRSAEAADRRRG
jgi:hypothetical protein